MKKILLGIAVLLVAAYVAATPVITAYQMKAAAEAQDGEALSTHIDFPAVREGLKEQLNVAVAKQMASMGNDNPLAALGAAFAPMLVDKMVDGYVTPTAIASMLEGEASDPENDPFKNARLAYASPSRFVISIPDEEGLESHFILSRQGLDWKLTNIQLPLDEMSAQQGG